MFVQSSYRGGDMRETTAVGAPYEAVGRGMVLLGAFVSFVLSVSLWFTGHHDQGIFVGLWVPSILALGGLAGAAR
jgi:hypothetical protein